MPSSSTVKAVAKSSLWLTISYSLSKISQLVSQVILARLLTPEDFGIWGMVAVITTLSELFKDTAIAQVIVQRGLEQKSLIDAVYSLGVSISLLMFIVQSILGYPLSLFFGVSIVWPLTACTALIFIFGAGAGAHGAVLARRMQFRELAIADVGAGLARLSGAIIGASLGWGVWSFAIAEVARSIVDAILKRGFSRYPFQYFFRPDPAAVENVQSYINSLIGINLAVYANTNGDNLIVGRILGAQALGYYNMAYQLSMLPAFALSQVNRVNLSVLSQRTPSGQHRYVQKMLALCALLSAPVYGVGFIVAPWLIPLLYGSDWTAVIPLFRIILIFAYSRGFMAILGTTLNALDKPQINAAINWVLVPISVPAFLLSSWRGGLQGIAISVALIMGVGASSWFMIATSQVMKCSQSSLTRPIVLPTISIVLATIVALYFPHETWLWKGLQPIFLLLIYGCLISLGSRGRVPRSLFDLGRNFWSSKGSGSNFSE